MESLGITIKVGEDRDLAQKVYSLLESIGFKKYTSYYPTKSSPWVYTNNNGNIMNCSFKADNDTEITLPQLRDLVVLKRNDVGGATHFNAMMSYYKACDGWYYFDVDVKRWLLSVGGKQTYYDKLNPITKEEGMKEYLNPNQGYKLVTCKVGYTPIPSNWIEVPEGADIAACTQLSREITFFKDGGCSQFDDGKWHKCGVEVDGVRYHDIGEFLSLGNGAQILWQRETLNDKVASAETARQADKVLKEILEGEPNQKTVDAIREADQIFSDADAFIESNVEQGLKHSHYKKDVSNLECIDVYRVLDLFAVENPCLQHAIKKLLCAGQRGSKGRDQDVKEAIDTLVRFQEMRKEDGV